MNFLALAKQLCIEAGIAGDGPATVVNQTREMRRVVGWIQAAWREIQQERTDFQFLRKEFTVDTVAGKQNYSLSDIGLDDFASWLPCSFRIYPKDGGVGGETFLDMAQYPYFRDVYMVGARPQGQPSCVTIAPDRSLVLGPIPDRVYTVSGEYYRTPQELTLDADVPLMPERFHMAIVYKAQMKYGLFEAAQEQIEAGKAGYAQLLNRLVIDQTPMVQMGGSLI